LTSDNSNTSKVKKIIGYTLPLVLMVVLLYFSFRNTNFDEVISILQNMSLKWYTIFLVVWFFSHWLRAVRWKVIIHSVKEDTSTLNLFGATMVGYGVNCVVPRLGEIYRGLFLGKWEDISRSSMIGTIVLERVIDILVLGFSVLISVAIYSGNLYSDITWLRSTVYLGFAGIFGIMVILLFLIKFKEKFYNAITKFVGKFSTKLADALARAFHLLLDGLTSIKGAKNYFYIISLSALIMVIYALTSYIAFFILGMQNIQEVDFAMAWIVMSIGAFGVVIPTPGATGSYHLIVIFVLISLFNFNQEISSAYALLTHTTSVVLFILSTVFLTYFINKRQAAHNKPSANFLTVFKQRANSI